MSTPLERLAARATRGDAEARDRLLSDVYPRVERMVHRALQHGFRRNHRWMLPVFSTGDIVQDVFLGVVRSLPEDDERGEDELLAWIATQIKNRIVDRLRFHLARRRDARADRPLQAGEGSSIGVPSGGPTPSQLVSLDERMRLVEQVLGGLGGRERRLWSLRVDEERSFAEVAGELGYASAESARSAFRRVQARIAVELHRRGVGTEGSESGP